MKRSIKSLLNELVSDSGEKEIEIASLFTYKNNYVVFLKLKDVPDNQQPLDFYKVIDKDGKEVPLAVFAQPDFFDVAKQIDLDKEVEIDLKEGNK